MEKCSRIAPGLGSLTCKMGITSGLLGQKQAKTFEALRPRPVNFREIPAAFMFHSGRGWGGEVHVFILFLAAFS